MLLASRLDPFSLNIPGPLDKLPDEKLRDRLDGKRDIGRDGLRDRRIDNLKMRQYDKLRDDKPSTGRRTTGWKAYSFNHGLCQFGRAPEFVAVVLLWVEGLDEHRTESYLLLLLLLSPRRGIHERHPHIIVVIVVVSAVILTLACRSCAADGRRCASAHERGCLLSRLHVRLVLRLPAALFLRRGADLAAADDARVVGRRRPRERRSGFGWEGSLAKGVRGGGGRD